MAAASFYNRGYSSPSALGPPTQLSATKNMNTTNPNSTGYFPLQQPEPIHLNAEYSSPKPPPKILRASRKRFDSLRRSLRILKLATASITNVLNTILLAVMLFVNIKFYHTRSWKHDGQKAWPDQTKVWPTIMLLAAAAATLVISVIVMIKYCRNSTKAKGSWKITLLKYAIHIGVWVVVSALYKYEKGLHGNNNDVWGWSCQSKNNAVQQAFNGKINFGVLCELQSRSWNISLAEPIVKIVFAIGHFWLKRKIEGEKQNFADNAGGAAVDLLQNVF